MKFNFPDHKAKREKRSHMPQRMEVSENMIENQCQTTKEIQLTSNSKLDQI